MSSDQRIWNKLQSGQSLTRSPSGMRKRRKHTAYFLLNYRLAMQLPPCESPLKTSTQLILAYV